MGGGGETLFQADQQSGVVQTLTFDFSSTTALQIAPYWSYPTVGYYGQYIWGPFSVVDARFYAAADLDGNGLNDIIAFPGYYNVAVPVSPVVFLNEGNGNWTEKIVSLPTIEPQSVDSVFAFSWNGATWVMATDSGWEVGQAGAPATKDGNKDILLKWDAASGGFDDETALLPNNGLNFNHLSWGGHITAGAAYDVLVPRLGGIQGAGAGLTWYEFAADGTVVDKTADLPAVIQYQDQGTGLGLYSASPSYRVGSAAAADLDGDGRAEIITGQYDPALQGNLHLSIWAQKADGSFSATPVLISAPAFVQDPANGMSGAVQIAAADIEASGRPDLVVMWESGNSQYIQILHNNGGLDFTDVTAQFLPQGAYYRSQAAADAQGNYAAAIGKFTLEDVNGDGLPDLVLSLQQSTSPDELGSNSQDFIYINEGGKYFAPLQYANLTSAQISALSQSSTITGTNLNTPIVADVTGDGVADLVSITAAEGQPVVKNGLDFAPYYDLTVTPGSLAAAQHVTWSQSAVTAAAGTQVLSLFGEFAASRAQSFSTVVSVTAYAQIPSGHDDFTVSVNGTQLGSATFAENATGSYVDGSGTAWTTETVSFTLSGLTAITSLSLGIDATTEIKAVDVNGVALTVGSGFSNPGSTVTLDASPWNTQLAAAQKIGTASAPIAVTGGGGTDIVEVLGSPADYTVGGVGTGTVTLGESSGLGQNAVLSGVSAIDFSDGARLDLGTGLWTVKTDVADLAGDLDMLQSFAAKGTLSSLALTDGGVPNLTVTAAQFTADAGVLADISSAHSVTVQMSGNASSHDFTGENWAGANALQFADQTVIVAATPGTGTAGHVTTGNVTELYSAVLAREPDVSGLAFYQNFLKNNPSTPLIQFAEWFLSSSEYTAAHSYTQDTAGDTQFIIDSYKNLLNRAPAQSEIDFYLDRVLNQPGSQLQTHAQMLVYFSASQEFLDDVQITAAHSASAQHWLVLI